MLIDATLQLPSEEKIEEHSLRITEQDTHGFLSEYHKDKLSLTFAVLEESGIDLDRVHLFEFGSRHYTLALGGRHGSYLPTVSHFFAMSSELQHGYSCFDPMYGEDTFMEGVGMYNKDRANGRRYANLYDGIDLGDLLDRLRAYALPDFTAAQNAVEGVLDKGRIPLIFSHQVLNDPKLDNRFAFWQLPGIHTHHGCLWEMCRFHGAGEEEDWVEYVKHTASPDARIIPADYEPVHCSTFLRCNPMQDRHLPVLREKLEFPERVLTRTQQECWVSYMYVKDRMSQ